MLSEKAREDRARRQLNRLDCKLRKTPTGYMITDADGLAIEGVGYAFDLADVEASIADES